MGTSPDFQEKVEAIYWVAYEDFNHFPQTTVSHNNSKITCFECELQF